MVNKSLWVERCLGAGLDQGYNGVSASVCMYIRLLCSFGPSLHFGSSSQPHELAWMMIPTLNFISIILKIIFGVYLTVCDIGKYRDVPALQR